MFIDARKVEKEKVIDSDVCIIGAGAAGITLAKEFIDRPFRVCLVESGGLEPDEATQSLYDGEIAGLMYSLTITRSRYFGGTTNLWGGFCKPLEKNAFEYRPWVPHSGWPVKKTELIPYYERAQPLCELEPFVYDPAYWENKFKDPGFRQISFSGNRIVTELYQFSTPPTVFGKAYRQDIEQAGNVTTYLHANVVDIETTENEKQITNLRVATLEGNKFRVSSKIFILATGGIENARLLLISDKKGQTPGLGNRYDLVGRYFMEHPHFYHSGKIVTHKNAPYLKNYAGYWRRHKKKMLILTIADEVQKQQKLLNCYATLSEHVEAESFQKHIGNVISDLDAGYIAAAGRDAANAQPVVFDILTRAEQSPNPDSRVTLSNERDSLGCRRSRLDWRLSPIDIYSIAESLRIIGEELGVEGLGRVRRLIDGKTSWEKPEKLMGGNHHMGTTRMSPDPEKGVVDRHCQVHGTANLYIAGSSVFPTSGAANPHQTILALSIRLADHIKKIMA